MAQQGFEPRRSGSRACLPASALCASHLPQALAQVTSPCHHPLPLPRAQGGCQEASGGSRPQCTQSGPWVPGREGSHRACQPSHLISHMFQIPPNMAARLGLQNLSTLTLMKQGKRKNRCNNERKSCQASWIRPAAPAPHANCPISWPQFHHLNSLLRPLDRKFRNSNSPESSSLRL